MRNLDAPTKPEDPSQREIPSRTEGDAPATFSAPVAFMHEPASPRPMWVSVGTGAALLLTLNYIAARVFERD
ncbi:MAG: hypothetical protein ABI580_13380, partial [Burkholderiaceae bacterium]